ncbi:hypothetical protein ACIP4V_23785 [Streptomyces albidoflavus]
MSDSYPCPCCGHRVLDAMPGSQDADRTYGVSGTGLDWELDWTAPWEHLVEESRTCYLLEASEAPADDNIFVAPTWIDRTDLYPEK